MRQLTATIAITLALLLSGCAASRKAAAPEIPTVTLQEATQTQTIHTERIDTVFISLPSQSAERTTTEGNSHLETDYAESDAAINPDGTLTHTLKNKPQPQPVPVKNTTDTIYVEKTIDKPVPVYIPKEVERELTAWQRTRLKTWSWLLTALLVAGAWIGRKPLLTLARRLISKQ
ncbi:MAG: hypothetical protein HUK04_00485 [Bacteroidaceae bacterium]|nr:hypothetical protein [Bacteroidaceae bacterium]